MSTALFETMPPAPNTGQRCCRFDAVPHAPMPAAPRDALGGPQYPLQPRALPARFPLVGDARKGENRPPLYTLYSTCMRLP